MKHKRTIITTTVDVDGIEFNATRLVRRRDAARIRRTRTALGHLQRRALRRVRRMILAKPLRHLDFSKATVTFNGVRVHSFVDVDVAVTDEWTREIAVELFERSKGIPR